MATSVKQHNRLPAGRTLVVLDIENLMCSPRFDAETAQQEWARVVERCDIASDAHLVVGATCTAALLASHAVFNGARLVYRPGKDGADLALIAVLLEEQVQERFERVVIASGDGAFTFVARHLMSLGVAVTVVAKEASLSGALRRSVADVRTLADRVASGSAA